MNLKGSDPAGRPGSANGLADLTIAELAPMLESGGLSSTELTEAVLGRISELNPYLNSYITLTAESALAEAERADGEIAAGRYRGPLHGVPIGHKDVLVTRGVRTTAHSAVLGDWVPEDDATVVTRLAAAGTVSLGKLNTYEFACGATPVYGLPVNPWSERHITGGSSAGSASAVAAGLAIAATGTDTAGSIRVPSSFCGIVGLKPTYGLVSRAGVLPVSWSLDHVGPMTRSVMDAAIMLDAMAGHDPRDPGSAMHDGESYVTALGGLGFDGERDLRGLTLGVPRGFMDAPVQPDVVKRVSEAYEVLAGLGARLVEVELPSAAYTSAALRAVMWPESTAAHVPWLRDRPRAYDPATRRTVTIGACVPGPDYLRGQRLRQVIRRELDAVLGTVDALVWPGVMRTAFGVREPQAWSGQQTRLSNLTGTPSLVVPCGFSSEGLPVAIQINGKAFHERLLLRIAAAFEAATEHHKARPVVSRTEPPPPKDQFAMPPTADLSTAERRRLEDEVVASLRRFGIPLIEEDLAPLVDELHMFRRDLEAVEALAGTTEEPAVHQSPLTA